MNTSQRTQIYLPEDLRRAIDVDRKQQGETLAEYLRTAARERLQKRKKRQKDLRQLAEKLIGSIKPGDGGWADITAEEWRKERQEEDRARDAKISS